MAKCTVDVFLSFPNSELLPQMKFRSSNLFYSFAWCQLKSYSCKYIFFSGECSCSEDFLPHFNEEGTLFCYQEFLRGPCDENEQYEVPDWTNEFEPICVPTNCDKNQTKFDKTCVSVPACGNEEFVQFPSETNSEAICVDLLKSGERTEAIGGSKSKNKICKCKKPIGSKTKKGRRSPSSRNGGKIKVCCNQGWLLSRKISQMSKKYSFSIKSVDSY